VDGGEDMEGVLVVKSSSQVEQQGMVVIMRAQASFGLRREHHEQFTSLK
jgi:hypothetical protein